MLGSSYLSISNSRKSGNNSLSLLTLKSDKDKITIIIFCPYTKFAQPPLSPERVPNILPKFISNISISSETYSSMFILI